MRTPLAEVDITKPLVAQLLATQFSEYAHLPIQFLDEGWDNVMFRLDTDKIIRLPRREVGAKLLAKELKWLPKIGRDLPIPTPIPEKIGQPNESFPWQWSIIPWFEGSTADIDLPAPSEAIRMAEFLKKLHQAAPETAPINKSRGNALATKTETLERCWQSLSTKTDLISGTIQTIWATALAAPENTEKRWLHGDLHSRNIVVHQGIFSAIIDWGDVTSGDPATDLACLWMLFKEEKTRQEALKIYGASPALITRAKGWAVYFGTVLLETGLHDNPQHANIGRQTLMNLQGKEEE